MQEISTQDLLTYFSARDNRFYNKERMLFGLGPVNDIWTHFDLCNHDRGPLAINITTEYDDPDSFISGFQIQSLDKIETLGYNHSWIRYLNGNALISVTPVELEATLVFQIVKRKTSIFSLDLHFYDEVYEHLTLPGDFEDYISKYDRRLQAAVENRFKVNRN